MIQLERVSKADEFILQNMLQFYFYEFSRYIPSLKLESNGSYAPYPLENYWTSDHFHPFFIKKGGELIGFVLLESESEEGPNCINEFFIMAQFQGQGYGKQAATAIFKEFPGKWMVVEIEKNIPAQCFWRNLIVRLTNGNMKEYHDEQRRVIQSFHTDAFSKEK